MKNFTDKKVIVFDLDDTLYDEITFVKSGFNAVASYLEELSGKSQQVIYKRMKHLLDTNGRGSVFDDIVSELNLKSARTVKKCLAIYRTHDPKIELPASSIKCLKRLNQYPLYIVTDGNKIVQGNKIKALRVDRFVKRSFVTHRYGLHASKPSTHCFERICELEKVKPQNVVYIGDNPNKDFVGLKPHGFKTIRIKKGPFADVSFEKSKDADVAILSLDELTEEKLEAVWEAHRKKHTNSKS